MIIVRVELWPYGAQDSGQVIAEATIENRGEDERGHRYRATFHQQGAAALGIPTRTRVSEVFGHDRKQGVWSLIARALAGVLARDAAIKGQGADLPDDEMLGLFLDVLPAAWGFSEADFEKLLELPRGWLRAWRNHEVAIDDELALEIRELGALQRRLRLLRTPDGYSRFWHHRWSAHSPIGARTPWQAFCDDGPSALALIRQHLDSGWQ